MKLFVGNLPFEVNNADLKSVFQIVGPVKSAQVVINRKNGRSKGFGFIEFENPDHAKDAITKFEGATLNERALTVATATEAQKDAEANPQESSESQSEAPASAEPLA